jgi:ATP-binding cassette subfamily B protein
MFKYIRPYIFLGLIAAFFMVGEVSMDLLQPTIMSKIVDEGVLAANGGNMQIILRFGLQMILLVLVGGFCGCMNNVFVQMSSQNIGNDMRKDCFKKIMTFSFEQMDQFESGTLITRVTNDITQVQNYISQFVRGMIRTGMLTIGSIVCMFLLNPNFGKIILAITPFMVLILTFCLNKANPLFFKLQKGLDQLNSIMQEDTLGIRIIKASVRQKYENERFEAANDELIQTQFQTLKIFAFMNPCIHALMNTGIALILWFGWKENLAGLTSPGVIMAAISYTATLLNGITNLTMLFQNISRGLASWSRIKEILDAPLLQKDGTVIESKHQGKIEFDHVSFRYPGTATPVLQDLSFTIEPGSSVAILGQTGCGKSSLVHLIDRFYDASQGTIYIDGIDVKDYSLQALRQKIAICMQKSELFSRSIANNIAWGKENATKQEILDAATTAQAMDFIESRPEGFDTIVAQQGMSLSGGQKQRLSLARALIKDSDILIFDDSTSALDLKTEAALFEQLSLNASNKTRITITQRIATALRSEKIMVLENKQIEAFGSHEELMRTSKTYRQIYESQLGLEEA